MDSAPGDSAPRRPRPGGTRCPGAEDRREPAGIERGAGPGRQSTVTYLSERPGSSGLADELQGGPAPATAWLGATDRGRVRRDLHLSPRGQILSQETPDPSSCTRFSRFSQRRHRVVHQTGREHTASSDIGENRKTSALTASPDARASRGRFGPPSKSRERLHGAHPSSRAPIDQE